VENSSRRVKFIN